MRRAGYDVLDLDIAGDPGARGLFELLPASGDAPSLSPGARIAVPVNAVRTEAEGAAYPPAVPGRVTVSGCQDASGLPLVVHIAAHPMANYGVRWAGMGFDGIPQRVQTPAQFVKVSALVRSIPKQDNLL